MTALLEFKQKIKSLYSKYEMYLQPLIKFVLALIYFVWINSNMGYMTVLDNIFVVLILALICSILPSAMMIFTGYGLMVAHSYVLGIDVAAFMLDLPVLLPIGCGLLGNALSALPAAGGVIIYYFIRFIRTQSQILLSADTQIFDRITILADGLMKNGEMWLTLVAFVAVILAVNLIRTRTFDYAWHTAIVAGGVIYVVLMLAGSSMMGVSISVVPMIIFAVVAVLLGLVLEFFVYGGDYTRTERLEYEDDEYYYYVKAVPKALVTTSERSIKKINAEPAREERKQTERVVKYNEPLFQGEEAPRKRKKESPVQDEETVMRKPIVDDVDFEKKLEESLKDL